MSHESSGSGIAARRGAAGLQSYRHPLLAAMNEFMAPFFPPSQAGPSTTPAWPAC